MRFLRDLRYKKLSQNARVEDLVKEAFRKAIHLCTALVPLFARYFFYPTVLALSVITCLYIVFEILRLRGYKIFMISSITGFAARERDKGKFVLGPVTLSVGVISTLLIFPFKDASIGIMALALGDGLASLVGKFWGRHHLNISKDKTIAGSIACFMAVFISTFVISLSLVKSLFIAGIAAGTEALPLKDFDNILIPLICAGAALILGV
ncbi:phosphatidate cytidylyltransferase [Treponema sp. OMZ 788]|uniref:diacylglycerol/polyprenol kinase family protein n=1 Tax=unclassified Treponema TaxID=2638727 RepID=UPI0020A2DE27|nr:MULTISPECIES: diacylglycerol/polyprenol kinase family protein [unclassified Treponema]UTC62291.1 phosphatidate cytidylyltransferase [Treponema sp. OMZ 787]UTC64734.1 phosphatidate cytidylyltransferase [Treponema sp. OMZ 788]